MRALGPDHAGAAAIEFALMSTLIFAVLLPALDFAAYAQQKLRLGSAVEQGAMLAFAARSSAPAVNTGGIVSYIDTATGNSPTTVIQCNGASTCDADAPAARCIGASATAGGPPTFAAPVLVAGVSTCTSGQTPGYYVVVRSSQAFRPLAIPDKWLGGSTIVQQAVARLS